MKKSRLLTRFVGCVALSLSTLITLAAFDGKVVMSTTAEKAESQQVFYIKGNLMRIERVVAGEGEMNKEPERNTKGSSSGKRKKRSGDGGGEGQFVYIYNGGKKEVTMLMVDEKTYMVHSITEFESDIAEAAKKDASDFTPTGRTEVIAGYKSDEWAGISEGRPTAIWVTKELGTFYMGEGPGASGGRGKRTTSAWEKLAQDKGVFIMRMVQAPKRDASPTYVMEVKSVDKGTQPDSLFVPPPDFTKFEIPKMGDFLKGAIPGMR